MDNMEKKHPLADLMGSTLDKVRAMADTNTIVGQPIATPDGVTLIPIPGSTSVLAAAEGITANP